MIARMEEITKKKEKLHVRIKNGTSWPGLNVGLAMPPSILRIWTWFLDTV